MNEVLEKDVAAESGKKPEIQRTFDSLDALKTAIQADPAVREDYLNNPNEYKIAEKVAEDAAPAQPEAPAEPATPAKKKVTVEVDEELLGTYGKNREANEAILEALKGNKEKDKTISFLKDEKLPALERELAEMRVSLKKQIEEFEKKKAEIPAAQPKVERPKFPEIGDDEDLFDEASQKKLRETIKATTAYMTSLETELAGLKNAMSDMSKARENDTAAATQNAQVAAEFKELDALIAGNKDVLGESRPFKEMQDDYVAFMDALKVNAGISGPLFNEQGQFIPDVQKQYALFHEQSDAGKALRDKLAAKNIGLPKDFGVLQSIYSVREIRNNHFERGTDGKPEPIAYEKALRLYKPEGKAPVQPASDPGKKKAEIDKRAQAAESVANASRELPAGEGGALVDVENYPLDKFMVQMKKPVDAWTDFEVTLFKQVAKARGLNDDFIKNHLGTRF